MPVYNDGHHIIIPTSVSSTGAGNSSSINTNGSVSFTNCETISLNGIFSSTYDNYMIIFRSSLSGATYIDARLRSSGTDATAANYAVQYLFASTTTLGSLRSSSQTGFEIGYGAGVQRNGFVCHIFGPNLAQPTSTRSYTAADYLDAYIHDSAGTHSLSTSYDGMTLYSRTAGRLATGRMSIYGVVK